MWSETRKLSRDKNKKLRRKYVEDAMHYDTLNRDKHWRSKNKYVALSFLLLFVWFFGEGEWRTAGTALLFKYSIF